MGRLGSKINREAGSQASSKRQLKAPYELRSTDQKFSEVPERAIRDSNEIARPVGTALINAEALFVSELVRFLLGRAAFRKRLLQDRD